MEVRFTTDDFAYRTVFLDTPLTEGIFWWEVRIAYAQTGHSNLWIGAAPASRLNDCNSQRLGAIAGTASLHIWKNKAGALKSGLYGIDDEYTGYISSSRYAGPVTDSSSVAIEADTHTGTLCFFINGSKAPGALFGMSIPMHFGMTGDRKPSFTSVYFRRLPSSTPSSVTPEAFKVRENEQQ